MGVPRDPGGRSFALVTWVLSVAWFTVPLLAGLGARFADLAAPCGRRCDQRGLGVLLESQASALRDLGVPLDVYASFDVGREVLLVVACVAVGTVMVWRVGSRASLLAAVALLATGAVLVPETTTVALERGGPLIPIVVASAFPVAVCVFFFLLPDGRWHPRWIRWVVGAWVATATAMTALVWPRTDAVVELQFVTMLALIPVGVVAQVHRVRVATGVERQRAKWVSLGSAAWLGSLVLYLTVIESGLLPADAAGLVHPLGYLLYGTALTAVVAVLPIAWSFAVLRHRLWDVDRLVGRSTLALVTTGAAFAGFGLLVVALGLVAGTRWELSIPIAAVVSLVAVVPLQTRIRSAVERLLYGQRGDPYDLLSHLWATALDGVPTVGQLEELLRQLVDGLHLRAGRLVLQGTDADIADLRVGATDGEPTDIPLTTGRRRIGSLSVWPRTGEHRLSRRDAALVEDAAAPITHVAAMVLSTEELRLSRADIIAARDEERRRLQHDLHDDLGPTIAVQAMLIDAAAEALVRDPPQAETMLTMARERNDHLVAEVRRLATDLHPPVLDRLGFIGALHQLVTAAERAGLRVDLDVAADTDRALPVAVESAVYRIACEALANAVRHADATRVEIRLAHTGGDLLLTVADDGRGGVPTRAETGAGTGLASMRLRARELGGTLTVASRAGRGTTVTLLVALP